MPSFFGNGGGEGFRIDPNVQSTFEHDYWEEFSRVNGAFSHDPDIEIRKVKKLNNKVLTGKSGAHQNGINSKDNQISPEVSQDSNKDSFYPSLSGTNNGDIAKLDHENDSPTNKDLNDSEYTEYRSIAIQTEQYLYDQEPDLPYKCCCCMRSSTPCVVWIFVGISIVFFKMGAIVTGRWIYLSSSSFDEVTFYIAFSVCLGFATVYFRRGTKYHNPFDLLFLMLTVPIMWALLTFTTTFLKKDMFFYVGSAIYSGFIVPYSAIGCFITYKFWKKGKIFLRRVEGDKTLETDCRKLFFAQSLMVFDTQLTICAGIISMAPTVNGHKIVWISSLVFAPISIITAIVALLLGYIAIRKEFLKLTIIYSVLSANPFILVICMLLKRPKDTGIYYGFINAAIVFSSAALLIVHIVLLIVIWKWIVPSFGKGLKGPISRTSKNNCIQCATLTICR